ncbi:MAG TPA: hypothetical protein VMU84_04230 [Thermoanaerobaculia bacterium]|nr:hypothetical protein [Thermoanaerobaculia bacterium]
MGGATKDAQSITADWRPMLTLIDGVIVRDVVNVPKENGYLTELARVEWLDDGAKIEQVFQVVLNPGGVAAWHAHAKTTDRLFVAFGSMRIVLYDAREDSPTRGAINELRSARRGLHA